MVSVLREFEDTLENSRFINCDCKLEEGRYTATIGDFTVFILRSGVAKSGSVTRYRRPYRFWIINEDLIDEIYKKIKKDCGC